MRAQFLLVAALVAAWLAADVGIGPASAAALRVAARPVPVVDSAVCPLQDVPPLGPAVVPCL